MVGEIKNKWFNLLTAWNYYPITLNKYAQNGIQDKLCKLTEVYFSHNLSRTKFTEKHEINDEVNKTPLKFNGNSSTTKPSININTCRKIVSLIWVRAVSNGVSFIVLSRASPLRQLSVQWRLKPADEIRIYSRKAW